MASFTMGMEKLEAGDQMLDIGCLILDIETLQLSSGSISVIICAEETAKRTSRSTDGHRFPQMTQKNLPQPDFQHSSTPALQHSSTPALQHSSTPALQHRVPPLTGYIIPCVQPGWAKSVCHEAQVCYGVI
jgi:hypothetical protein